MDREVTAVGEALLSLTDAGGFYIPLRDDTHPTLP